MFQIVKVFVIVTPTILRVVTRSTSAIGSVDKIRCLFLLSLNTISGVFFRFSARLLIHTSVAWISDMRESTLHAGTIKYVSAANLHIALPGVATFKSAAVTTYDAGSMAEPCMMLKLIICTVDC